MATIDPVAPPLPDADGRPHGPLDAAARWRYELERAQWQLRSGGPTGAAVPSARAAPQAETTQTTARPVAGQSEFPEVKGARASSAQFAVELSKNPSSEIQSPPARGEAKIAGYAIEPVQPRDDGGARLPAPVERALRPLRVTWPRVNVHATLQEGEAQVWVRDASIAREDRHRLAAEVAARLRAAGLRLGRLYLNGEEIPTIEGGASWR